MEKGRRTALSGLLFVSILFAVAVAGVYFVSNWSYWSGSGLTTLWQQGEYQKLAQLSEERLARDPFDLAANVFGGLGYFYASLGSEVYLQSWPDLKRSVQLIRRALSIQPETPIVGQLYYILGKSYSRMGGQYLDLAPRYLELSLKHDYTNDDTFESLALSYLRLQDHARSLAYLVKAEAGENSDDFLLAFAESLEKVGRVEQAEEKLLQLLKVTQNDRAKQDALLQLAEIHYNEGRMDAAEGRLRQALDLGPRAAAFYLLGELYRQRGDLVKARAYWRDALRADPEFAAARSRLVEG